MSPTLSSMLDGFADDRARASAQSHGDSTADVAAIRAQVRRRRGVRGAGVILATVAAVSASAIAVQGLVQEPTVPPAVSVPTPTMTGTSEPEPTMSPTPSTSRPTPSPDPTQPPATEEPGPSGATGDIDLGMGGSIGGELWRPEADALAALSSVLGPPDATEEVPRCRDGAPARLHRWDDFELRIALEAMDAGGTVPGLDPVEPPFVDGWTLRGPSPALRTGDGLSIGTSFVDALTLYPDAYPSGEASTWEVFRGDYSVMTFTVTSADPSGSVTAIASGGSCER